MRAVLVSRKEADVELQPPPCITFPLSQTMSSDHKHQRKHTQPGAEGVKLLQLCLLLSVTAEDLRHGSQSEGEVTWQPPLWLRVCSIQRVQSPTSNVPEGRVQWSNLLHLSVDTLQLSTSNTSEDLKALTHCSTQRLHREHTTIISGSTAPEFDYKPEPNHNWRGRKTLQPWGDLYRFIQLTNPQLNILCFQLLTWDFTASVHRSVESLGLFWTVGWNKQDLWVDSDSLILWWELLMN